MAEGRPGEYLGLIVNPKAGLGGSVGLKGSDGTTIQQEAVRLGGVSHALERAGMALEMLRGLEERITILTCPAEMGADAVRGFRKEMIGQITPGHTTSADTRRAVAAIKDRGATLLLFAGGDGTARDILDAIGTDMAVLGLPAGVKIHSSVYAVTPRAAGVLARRYLEGRPAVHLQEAEVMDLDEEALRRGSVSARLYGYLSVPYEAGFVQNPKSSSPATDRVEVEEIANSIASQMEPDTLYILGPGTTTRAITDRLGLAKTLTGVDAVLEGKLIAADASEQRLLSLLAVQPRAKIIITPVGGQGYLLGRGNQQISPAVIRRVGKENLIVASTVRKLISLGGRPLLVDTGDESTDRLLQGYLRIATGQGRSMVYRVSSEVEVTGPSDTPQAQPG